MSDDPFARLKKVLPDVLRQEHRARLPGLGVRREAQMSADKVDKIPKKIQHALDALGIRADGGYFSRRGGWGFRFDTVFTAWWKGECVQVLGYDAEQSAWVPFTDKDRGVR